MVLKLVPQLAVGVERVVFHHHRAQAQDGVERHNVLRGVGKYQCHTVTALDPKAFQAGGGPPDLVAHIAVACGGTEELQRGFGTVFAD